MGAASSKNVAESIANVMNMVQNSTIASTTGVQNLTNSINLNNCTIRLQKNFNVDAMATNSQKSSQILSATQDTTLTNTIQQAMVQEAVSKVGSLGIGYASASNTASQLSNTTNQVIQIMKSSIAQYTDSSNYFNCNNSTIEAENLNISFNNTNNFVSDTVLSNNQTTQITNTVSQSISQKASATVAGIAGFLIALALLIAAIGWSLSKPIAAGGKSIAIAMVVGVLLLFIVIMYLFKAPPFFADYIIVSPNNPTFGAGNNPGGRVVEVKKRTVTIEKAPPLRYNFPIVDQSSQKGVLTLMAISKLGGNSISQLNPMNSGFNAATWFKMALDVNDYSKNGKWNVDTVGLYKKVFAAYANPEQYQLPNLLYIPTGLRKDKEYFALFPDCFYNNCSPAVVSFGMGGGQETNCKCSSFNKGAQSTTITKCCNALNVSITDWLNRDDESDDTTFKLPVYTAPQNSRIIAQYNEDAWNAYLHPSETVDPNLQTAKILYARFWLCYTLGIPCDVYVLPEEPVAVLVKNMITVGLASEYPDQALQFTGFQSPNGYENPIPSGGLVTGQFGYADNNTYRFKKFMKKVGGWLLLLLIIMICVLIAIKGTKFWPRKKNTNNTTKKSTSPPPQSKKTSPPK